MRNQSTFFDKILIPLVILTIGVFGFLTFKHNPLLMSSKTQIGESRKKETFKPTVKLNSEKPIKAANFLSSFSNRPKKSSISKLRISQHIKTLDNAKPLTFDGTHFYFTKESKSFYKVDESGKTVWGFQLESGEFLDPQLTIGENAVYLFTKDLKLFVLDKDNGELLIIKNLVNQPIGQPLLISERLIYYYQKKKSTSYFFEAIDINDLKVAWKSKPLNTEPFLSFSPYFKRSEFLLTLKDGHLILLKAKDGIKLWKKQAPELPQKAAQILTPHIYLVGQENQLYALDLLGTPDWDYKLKGNPTHELIKLPNSNLIALQTENKYLHVIDKDKGEGKWHFKLTVESEIAKPFPIKLNATEIENFNLGWTHKGWVVASHCTNDRICLFAPKNGRILSSFSVRGVPKTPGLFYQGKKGIYFFVTSVSKWVNKLGYYDAAQPNSSALALVLDAKTLKRKEEALEKENTKKKLQATENTEKKSE